MPDACTSDTLQIVRERSGADDAVSEIVSQKWILMESYDELFLDGFRRLHVRAPFRQSGSDARLFRRRYCGSRRPRNV
jgi:hypothetical protein